MVNAATLNLIKSFESCRLQAYLDSKGIPTIGWGHTQGVQMGQTCTQAQADAWLVADIHEAEAIVRSAVTVPLTDNQFGALVSFVYNIGGGRKGVKDGLVELVGGGQSRLLKYVNSGDFENAAQQFKKWVRSGGMVLAGLARRRDAEEALFRS